MNPFMKMVLMLLLTILTNRFGRIETKTGKVIEAIKRSFFIKLEDQQIRDIQENITACAKKWLFPRSPLTETQIKIFRRARERLPKSAL